MGCDQLVTHWRVQQIADLGPRVHFIDHLQGIQGENPQLAVSSASPRSYCGLVWTKTNCLHRSLVLVPAH